MPSDFETLARDARASITVPAMNLQSIRQASVSPLPARRKPRVAIVSIAAAFSMAAVAAAAVVTHSHFTVTKSGGLVIAADKMEWHKNPSDADIQAVVAKARFRVTLPAGLPAGTQLKGLWTISSDGIILAYDLPGAWRAAHHRLNVVLVNPAALQGDAGAKRRMLLGLNRNKHDSAWRIGDEMAFVQTSVLTAGEAARVKAAMQKEAGQ